MKFTKENLAAEIAGKIENEKEYYSTISDEIDFDNGVVVWVDLIYDGHMGFADEWNFSWCDIKSIEVYHEDPDEDFVFNDDELVEIEELVKLWM